ncbi:MAG: polysaccharide biosynthesis protein [Phycisphaeraceae bacterium]|nr:polysaccharide biosynthesis protein [Phycisphaeraceae bacterium]
MSRLPTPLMLVGTADTLSQLAALFRLSPELPQPLGGLLVGPGRPRDLDILGHLPDLPHIAAHHRPAAAVVCLPEAMRHERQAALAILHELGIHPIEIPPLADQLTSGSVQSRGPAPLQPTIRWEELINRTPYDIDRAAISRLLENQCVLITGAGGSIGSEIARIVAGFRPSLLVLMERSENALFEINRQIAARFPSVPRKALLHDVVDVQSTRRRILECAPHAIFHAAAHKHVPLMEEHPSDAMTNNVTGTRNVAEAALEAGAAHFVLISSDKAVNPTSVMGASKRLAELFIQGLQKHGPTGTRFSMVRFGNVLGSAGSVIPIWSAQLSEGGPVTITDPRMTRYFMTIPEAASLVILAATLPSPPGEAPVYVLDMGEPVRILDLAARFIAAHGFTPRVITTEHADDFDWPFPLALAPGRPPMDIVFTGIRPGEKLFEQLAYDSELLLPTPYPGINAWTGEGHPVDIHAMARDLAGITSAADHTAVHRFIRKYLPEIRGGLAQKLAG